MIDPLLNEARNYIKSKPYLAWGTSNYNNLSYQVIAEDIFNYGNWEDFQYIKKLFGMKEINKLFKEISSKKRTNLKPQTRNYFTLYLNKNA
ncbi:MAG: hypothetical protein WAX66_02635 [Patescibacteria group bacterium]|jgi:hypothetical protein